MPTSKMEVGILFPSTSDTILSGFYEIDNKLKELNTFVMVIFTTIEFI